MLLAIICLRGKLADVGMIQLHGVFLWQFSELCIADVGMMQFHGVFLWHFSEPCIVTKIFSQVKFITSSASI